MFQLAHDLAQTLQDRDRMARALRGLADVSSAQSDDKAALKYLQDSLMIQTALGNRAEIASLMEEIGMSNLQMSNYPAALEYAGKARALYEEFQNQDRIAATFITAGNAYRQQANYSQASD